MTYPRKLKSLEDDRYGDEWPCHPAGLDTCNLSGPNAELYETLVRRRNDVLVHAEYSVPDLRFEYDELALIELDGMFYILQTSGCSCPSPSETWIIDKGPGTRSEVAKAFLEEHCRKGWKKQEYGPAYKALFGNLEVV